jgi:hypothetical protein
VSGGLELDLPARTRLVAAPGPPATLTYPAVFIVEDHDCTTVCLLNRDQLALLRDWCTLRLAAL